MNNPAQSHSSQYGRVINRTWLVWLLCGVSVIGSIGAQTVTHAEDREAGQRVLPTNLLAPSMLEPLLVRMWLGSPTFKAQCARVRVATFLIIDIRFSSPGQFGGDRGHTIIIRSSTRIEADVYINPMPRAEKQLIEMMAHEIEHVIEQLDGVDLQPDSRAGVFLTPTGFETARAIHVGQKVAEEVSISLTVQGIGKLL